MNKNFKIFASTIICGSLIATNITSSYAYIKNNDNYVKNTIIRQNTSDSGDIYESNYEEIVNLDGVNYTYKYYYSSDNSRNIDVINNSTGEKSVVSYNEELGELKIDEEIVSKDTNKNIEYTLKSTKKSSYTYIGSINKKISWKKTTTAMVLAAGIAARIGNITGSVVIASMGSTAITSIISMATNGTVRSKIYKGVGGKITPYKYVWSFTPVGGKKYGDYTSYRSVEN